MEQLEDRLVPTTTLKLDVGATSPVIQANPGSTVKVFVDIGTLDQAGGISSAQFYVAYDPAVLAINELTVAPGTTGSDIKFGSVLAGSAGYQLGAANGAASGLVGVSIINTMGTFYTGTAGGQLVELDFHVLPGAPGLGSTLLDLRPNSGSTLNVTYVADQTSNNYTFSPAPLSYTGTLTQSGAKAPSAFTPADTDTADASIEIPVTATTATTTTLATSNATPVYGTPVTLTATVTPTASAAVPTQGSVQFFDGTTLLGVGTYSNPQDANNDAVFTYVTTATQLQVAGGKQALTAVYTPGAGFAGSTSSNTVTETVTPLTLAVTGITASNKVYDSTTAATVTTSGAGLAGYFIGDAVTVNTAGAAGTFDTKDVGTGKTVTITGLSLTGAQASDYALPAPEETTTANVTPKMLTIAAGSITANNKVYDATRAASLNTSNAAIVGTIFPGDTVSLVTTQATGTFAIKDVGTGIVVVVSGLTLGGAQGVDYSLPGLQSSTVANITPRTIDVTGITANNKTYDGSITATLNTSSAALSGVFGGDSVSLVTTGIAGTFNTKDVGTGKIVTITGLGLADQPEDYALPTSPLTTTANITPKTLTVSGITANNKTYDGTTAATLNLSGATLSGIITGDTVSLVTSGAVGTFAQKDVGTGITVTISGLSLAGAQASDYALPVPQDTTTANITPLTLTVTGITANNKVYDQTTVAALNTSGATLAGTKSGDAVTLVTAGAVGTFAKKDVGTGITVTISGLTLSGAQASDYALPVPQDTTTANITPAPVTVTGISATKVYDSTTLATLNTTNATLAGAFAGDAVTLNTAGAVGTYATKDVGTNIPLTISGLTLTGAQAGDYALPATGTGLPAGVVAYYTFQEGSPNAYAFGTNSILDSSGNGLNGTAMNGPIYRQNVPTNPVPQTGAPNNLALAFNGNFQQFVAIADNPLFYLTQSMTIEAYVNVSTFTTSNTGNQQEIVFRGDDRPGLDPYQLEINGNNLEFQITDATNTSASVSAPFTAYQNKWALVTATLDNSTGTMSLYVNGSLVGSVTTTIRPFGALMANENPGLGIGNVQDTTSIPAYFNGLIDDVLIDNQALQPSQFLDVPPLLTLDTGTITPAPLTVTGVTASNKTYDSTTTATLNVTNASLVGVFGGDTVTLGTSGRVGTFASKNVGPAIPVTVTGLTLGGPQAGDYTLTQPTTSANITPKTVTGSFTAANKPYDGTTTATITNRTLTGVLSADTGNVALTGGTATFSDPNVGTGKTVTGTGFTLTGSAAMDYSFTTSTLTTTANITPLTITGSFTAANKPYDGTTTATITSRTLNGVLSADAANVTLTGGTATFSDPNVGTGKTVTGTGFTITGTGAANYTLASSTLTTTANITGRTLTVSGITANNKVYDGTTAATLNTGGAILTGILSGDAVTLVTSGAVGTFNTKDVGTGKTVTVSGLSLTGAQASEYVLPTPQETTMANITPATLAVTGITANNKTYDGTTAATVNTTAAGLTGVFTGDAVTLVTSGAIGTFNTKDVGTGKTVTVSGLSLTGAQASDYMLPTPQATTTANITPASLTVTGITVNNKVYDTTTSATLNTANGVLVGVYNGDSVALITSGATATFVSPAVGNNIPVTISGLTLGGPQANDYTLTQPTTTGNITPDLVNNALGATFGVPTTITSSYLRADSASNPSTVVFTLVSAPAGTLQDGSTTLTAGSTFTQADINAGNLVYTGNAIGPDSFQFTATDGRGGTVPLSTFHIIVNAEVLPPAIVGSISGLEGVSGGVTPFVFHVSLGAIPLTPVIFDVFTTDGTAVSTGANPNFYPLLPGASSPPYDFGTVSFARGQVRQTFTVDVIGGSIPAGSPSEYFIVSLSNPAYPTRVVASASGTIVAQGVAPIPLVSTQNATASSAASTSTVAASPFSMPLTSSVSVKPAPSAPAAVAQPASSTSTAFGVSLVSTSPSSGPSTAALDTVFSESLTGSTASDTEALDQVFAVLGSEPVSV